APRRRGRVEVSMLDAALRYAGRGWAVIPLHSVDESGNCSCGNGECKSPGKHPLTKNGRNDASTDEARIRAWWSKAPAANVAIATGSGLAVLDIDPRHGGDASLALLEDRYSPLGSTAEV